MWNLCSVLRSTVYGMQIPIHHNFYSLVDALHHVPMNICTSKREVLLETFLPYWLDCVKDFCLSYQSLNTKYLMNLQLHLPLAAGRNRLSKAFCRLWGWMLGLDHLLLLQPACCCFKRGFLKPFTQFPRVIWVILSYLSFQWVIATTHDKFSFSVVEWDPHASCLLSSIVFQNQKIAKKKKKSFHSAPVCSQIEFSLDLGIQPCWFTVGY